MTVQVQSAIGISRADECRRRAADCMKEAGVAGDDMLRHAYFQLAGLWKRLADRAGSSNCPKLDG
jgi:hypothetical protein